MLQLDKTIHTFAGAAIGKELWDAQGHGTPDRIDALVTVAGGVLMVSWLTLVS